jgi:hypothetical protein
MFEARVRRRRKRSNRSNDQLKTAVWIVTAVIMVVGLGATAWYAYSKLKEPELVGVPPTYDVSKICTLEEFVEEQFGSINKNVTVGVNSVEIPWEKTPNGKRFVTPQGFKFEIEYAGDRAVITIDGTIGKENRTFLMGDFSFLTSPFPRGDKVDLGDKGYQDNKALCSALEQSQVAIIDHWNTNVFHTEADWSGNLFAAKMTYDVNADERKVAYRLEIKKIGG